MATTWKAPTWRMPNEKNQNKFESYSLDFDSAISNYINCGGQSLLNGLTAFSISFWIKTNGTQQDYATVIGYQSSTSQYVKFAFYPSEKDRIRFNLRPGTTNPVYVKSSAGSIPDGEWVHVVGVGDSNNLSNLNLYINGVLDNDATLGNMTTLAQSTDIYIGTDPGAATTREFNGDISQTCIFDYALSSTQISSLYNSGSPINPMTLKPAPIAYYPLGGNASTGGDAINTLSVPNVAVPDASVFDFDGSSNDFIAIDENNDKLFQGVNAFTVSAWAKLQAEDGSDQVIVGNDSPSRGFYMSMQNSPVLKFFVSTTGSSNDQFTYSLPGGTLNKWIHFVAIWDGSNMDMYVNGIYASTKVCVNATGTFTAPTGTTIGKIGQSYSTTPTYDFDGKISNVQIWHQRLSHGTASVGDVAGGDIATLYNNGQPLMTGTQPQEANLQAWYKLNQSANWEADTTGNWQIPDAVSSYPQSFDFDNTANSHIKLGSSLGNSLGDSYSGDLTLSLWFNADTSIINKGLFQIGTTTSQGVFSVRGVSGTAISFGLNQIGYTSKFNFSDLNNWHHLVCVYKGGAGGSTIMYLDGVPQTTTDSGVFPTSLDFDTEEAYIGLIYNLTGYDWDGKISNVQFWNTEIPATGSNSVETLYNNGVPLTTAIASDNLKGWWKLDNTEVWSADHIYYNINRWNIDNNKYPSYFKTALEFNANEYVSLDLDGTGSSSSVIDSGSDLDLTFSYWVNPNYQNSMGSFKWGTGPSTITNWFINISHGRFPNKWNLNLYNDVTSRIQYDVPTTDIWYHLIVTRTASDNTWRMYVNDALIGSYSDGGTVTAQNYATKLFLGNGRNNSLEGFISNAYIWNSSLSATDRTLLYNNGRPLSDLSGLSAQPFSWWKLDNKTTGVEDSIGSNNATITGGRVADTLVSTQVAYSSGMTEQNLVNNNVSALNGESSGMNTSNLVTSTLTRQIPYNSYSLNFDGVNDYISIGSSIPTSNQHTVSTWIKSNDLTNSTIGYLFTTETTIKGIGLDEGDGSFGAGKFYYWNGSSPTVVSTTAITVNNWHYIAFVFDSTTNEIKFYLDGNLDKTTSVSIGTAANIKIIGSYNGTLHYLNGKLSNMSIFNEALTSTEIMKLYNSGVPSDLSSFTPSPISWWSLSSDSYFNGSNYICPDLVDTNNGTSSGMDANALVGDAPNSSANGTSTNMTIDANLTGSAPNSSNNSFSVNMSYDDRVSGSGDVPS